MRFDTYLCACLKGLEEVRSELPPLRTTREHVEKLVQNKLLIGRRTGETLPAVKSDAERHNALLEDPVWHAGSRTDHEHRARLQERLCGQIGNQGCTHAIFRI